MDGLLDRSMEMVEIEDMIQILHDEEMAIKRAKSLRQQKEIDKQEAKDKDLFKHSKHWTGQKATLTDVANDINPPRHKILTQWDIGIGRLENHYTGIMHGLYLRLSVVALLWLVYVYG
jgi:hypothetical protein